MAMDQSMNDMSAEDTGDTGDSADTSSGYTICIKVGPNNQVKSVDIEPAAEEAAEGEGETEESGTAVSSWKDAMQVAGDIYRNAGDMSESTDRAAIAKEVFGGSSKSDAGELARKPKTVGGY